MKYKIKQTSFFKKDIKKIKYNKNIDKLTEVINLLASNKELPEKYKDHKLNDNKYYKDARECHIEPDWLLIYKYQNDTLVLLLIRTGSHSKLFK